MKHIVWVFMIAVSVIACSKEVALNKNQFTALLIDMHMADGALEVAKFERRNEKDNYLYYNDLFKKYGITRADFDSCLNYYKHLRVEDTNRTKLTEALIYMGSLQYEEGEDLFGKVQDCLRKLPEQQRKVLEMKIFRDMSYKEIARELNLSEVTVHTHVKRAYKAIREALPVVYFLWSVLGKI